MELLVKDVLALGEKRLSEAGIEESKIDSEILFCHLNGLERSRLFMEWGKPVRDKTFDEYFELLDVRGTGKPLQYITGHQDFMGLDFKVNESVLIPRQDTEVLVSEALELIDAGGAGGNVKIKKVLDLCTGSGAIGISIAKLAKGVSVTATDISSDALSVAEDNAKTIGAKVSFAQGDLFDAVKKKIGKATFDMIVSNPPYIKSDVIETLMTEVKDHEPRLALDGGGDGLSFYRRIVSEAPQHLAKNGLLLLEIGCDQADDIRILASAVTDRRGASVYAPARVVKDLAGLNRVVILQKVL